MGEAGEGDHEEDVEFTQGEQVAVPDLVMGAPADGEGHIWGVLGGWGACKRTQKDEEKLAVRELGHQGALAM